MEKLGSSIIETVCKHDYGNSFLGTWHQGLHDFLSCAKFPENEFFDADLEGARAKLKERVEAFIMLIAQHTFLLRQFDDGSKLYRMNDDPRDNQALLADFERRAKSDTEFKRLIREAEIRNDEIREQLNHEAENLCDSYKEFVRFAKRALVI